MTRYRSNHPPRLSSLERDGFDHRDVHGYNKVFIALASVLVVFWGSIVWAAIAVLVNR